MKGILKLTGLFYCKCVAVKYGITTSMATALTHGAMPEVLPVAFASPVQVTTQGGQSHLSFIIKSFNLTNP